MPTTQSINDVIAALDNIILDAKKNKDSSGYFAALYRKVTISVKEGIASNKFENGMRMEKLDIVFASRYLDAWQAWKNKEPVSASWMKAFNISTHYWPIVLQHLLMGMNAHINLDLGIAAAAVTKNEDINSLHHDFNTINTVLSLLVNDVQQDLARTWPRLKWILQKTRGVNDFLTDFSMQLARDGAWEFATTLSGRSDTEIQNLIAERDKKVAEKSKIITQPGLIVRLIFGIIRIGEQGSIVEKIENLTK